MAEGEWKLNVPPSFYDGTTSGARDEEKILQKLSQFGDQAPNLINFVESSMLGVAEALQKLKKDIAADNKACSPSISMKLGELQTFLIKVIRKGRSYCRACTDLGEYASDEELIKEIYSDLERGQFNELNDFLDEIDDYLKLCGARYKRVVEASETAKIETRDAGEYFEMKRNMLLGEQKKELVVANASGCAASTGGLALAFFSPPLGIATIIAGVAAGVAATAAAAAAAGLTVAAGFSLSQIEIYTDACYYVIELDKSLREVINAIDDMHELIQNLTECGKRIDKLKEKTGTMQLRKVKKSLEHLKKEMNNLREESTKLMEKLYQP